MSNVDEFDLDEAVDNITHLKNALDCLECCVPLNDKHEERLLELGYEIKTLIRYVIKNSELNDERCKDEL